MPHPYDPSKPTLVLVNSFTTSSDLYIGQYGNSKLTSAMNLLAIELLGHGYADFGFILPCFAPILSH